MLTPRQLQKVRVADADYLARWKESGRKTAFWFCDHCNSSIETTRPQRKDVHPGGCWDSLKTCTNCGNFSMVQVFSSGKTVART